MNEQPNNELYMRNKIWALNFFNQYEGKNKGFLKRFCNQFGIKVSNEEIILRTLFYGK